MTKPGPGKFEFNESQEVSEILYEHSLDGSHIDLGESDTFGWYTLIESAHLPALHQTICTDPAYICKEDSQGFFHVMPFTSTDECAMVWADIEARWQEWIKDDSESVEI